MSPNVPIEVVEYAIDFLHDDTRSLTACALASRALLPAARFHIWREISVPVRAYPIHHRMQGLVEILEANADIAPLVLSLTLRGVLSPRGGIQQHWDDPAGTMCLWEKLPNLRVLNLGSLWFSMGLHQLLPMVYSLPNLEEIALANSIVKPLPNWQEYSTCPSYRDSRVDLGAPPKLRRFSITGGSTAWSFLEDLAKLLLEPRMHAPLETLDLGCIVHSSNFGFAAHDHTDAFPSKTWAPVIVSLGRTLRHCTLGLLEVECDPQNLTKLYKSLKQCTLLRSLSVKCNVLKRISNNISGHCPFIFIDILADVLFSSCPPPPFPELETLSIGWMWTFDPVPPECADACKNLAHSP